MVFACLLYFLALLASSLVQAADDGSQIGNRTIERTVTLRTHSIYAPYIDQDLQNRWWDFGADAYVNTNKHIRLARHRQGENGWLWSRLPISAANFVVEVEFRISGAKGHLYGDGLAIWLTKERAQTGPVFGSIDKFEGLGLFLDTYANARHSYAFPRVVAMLGDGKTQYDQDGDGEATNIGGCSANYRSTNVATKLKLTYLKSGYLDVKVHYRAWDDWSSCFTLRNVTLPDTFFLGFSAMTGDVSDDHDIISVTTSSALLSKPESPRNKLSTAKSSAGWTWYLVKLIFFVGVVAGALHGYKIYTLRSTKNSNNYSMSAGLGGGMGYYDNRRF